MKTKLLTSLVVLVGAVGCGGIQIQMHSAEPKELLAWSFEDKVDGSCAPFAMMTMNRHLGLTDEQASQQELDSLVGTLGTNNTGTEFTAIMDYYASFETYILPVNGCLDVGFLTDAMEKNCGAAVVYETSEEAHMEAVIGTEINGNEDCNILTNSWGKLAKSGVVDGVLRHDQMETYNNKVGTITTYIVCSGE